MALTFPPQPQTPGTPYEAPNGVTYIWDGVKWIASGTPGAGSANLGNLFIIDQTIAGLNEPQPVIIAGNVIVANLTSTTLNLDSHDITILDGNLLIDGTAVGQDNTFNQSLNTTDDVAFANVTADNMSVDTVSVDNVNINGVSLTTDGGTLYVGGTPVGGEGFANTLQNNGFTVALSDNGDLIIPKSIQSTATGIPEFNSTTDLNLNALNRVNIVQSPLNLASLPTNYVIGKPGDLLFDTTDKQIKTYANGAWETLLRTAENQNVRLPQGGVYQRADGVRAAWFTDLPTDISQLTDNNNLLTNESITLQNIDIDGGGAYSIYEIGLLFADGGFGSSRFGPSDTVFDGAGAGSTYTNTLNGGGA